MKKRRTGARTYGWTSGSVWGSASPTTDPHWFMCPLGLTHNVKLHERSEVPHTSCFLVCFNLPESHLTIDASIVRKWISGRFKKQPKKTGRVRHLGALMQFHIAVKPRGHMNQWWPVVGEALPHTDPLVHPCVRAPVLLFFIYSMISDCTLWFRIFAT